MKQDSPFQDFPAYVEKSSPKSKFLLIFVVVLFLLVGTLAGLYFLGLSSKKSPNTLPVPSQAIVPTSPVSPTATISASTSPTPSGKVTPTPTSANKKTIDRSALTIAVLNGSGTPGAAKEISAVLNGLGYTIKTIGNADNFAYENITIKIKKSKNSFLDQLKKDVAAKSTTTITTEVDDTISADAEVIVGK